MFVFLKTWCALFSCNTRFEIRPFALLPTILSPLLQFYLLKNYKKTSRFSVFRGYENVTGKKTCKNFQENPKIFRNYTHGSYLWLINPTHLVNLKNPPKINSAKSIPHLNNKSFSWFTSAISFVELPKNNINITLSNPKHPMKVKTNMNFFPCFLFNQESSWKSLKSWKFLLCYQKLCRAFPQIFFQESGKNYV